MIPAIKILCKSSYQPKYFMLYPIIFSDLDGTLLNQSDYSYTSAIPALEKIKKLKIPLILNSSKTLHEIVDIRKELGIHHPFVVENGAAIFVPQDYFPENKQPLTKHLLGPDRKELLATIHRLRKNNDYQFQGFADFTVPQLSKETGLSFKQAKKSKNRIGSEPIKWYGSQQSLTHFQKVLEQENLRLVKGGRFWHIMGQTDKYEAMKWLSNQYKKHYHKEILIIALGDSENDRIMLENADFAAAIKHPDGSHLNLSPTKTVLFKTKNAASAGWNEAISAIFKQINMEHLHE